MKSAGNPAKVVQKVVPGPTNILDPRNRTWRATPSPGALSLPLPSRKCSSFTLIPSLLRAFPSPSGPLPPVYVEEAQNVTFAIITRFSSLSGQESRFNADL